MSLKDEREYKLIEDHLVYLPDKKKWIAGYPWIRDAAELPDNRTAALAKLKTMERRLLSNPDHAALYNCQIEDMVERGVTRKLQLIEMLSYRGPVLHIPPCCYEAGIQEYSIYSCRLWPGSSRKETCRKNIKIHCDINSQRIATKLGG